MGDLAVKRKIGGVEASMLIGSNGKQECMRCGECITEANDSGWECFVSAATTQKICKPCLDRDAGQAGKKEGPCDK
jgi:hypothetical protein